MLTVAFEKNAQADGCLPTQLGKPARARHARIENMTATALSTGRPPNARAPP
eukprot:NODE_20364_length_801_cov_4.959941.p4 GENE.NODE_20364_length_801_cov_4.959941~~NODE_20364_length_801_cov_4.959941.p4  ORF type:complete len:52 (+),score=2.85 NODE_20364_length_801_cov_4.959941:571-726(+)